MSKSLVIGNGESRKWFSEKQYEVDAVTWGCNAIYRDIMVDNLVAVDYGMQQEIYQSNHWRDAQCWFANWSILPSEVGDMMFMGYDIQSHLFIRHPIAQNVVLSQVKTL